MCENPKNDVNIDLDSIDKGFKEDNPPDKEILPTEKSISEQFAISSGKYEDVMADSEVHYRELRGTYAFYCFVFMFIWCMATFLLILSSAIPSCPLYLSDSVLISLISGTTVNIIGLFVVILRGIFPQKI